MTLAKLPFSIIDIENFEFDPNIEWACASNDIKRILIFDTETTGLLPFNKTLSVDNVPRLVQLAFVILETQDDINFKVVFKYDQIITPTYRDIPRSSSDIHGITTQIAIEQGIELNDALAVFLNAAKDATSIVAHNMDFDFYIMQFEYIRCVTNGENLLSNVFKTKQLLCTKLLSMLHCKLQSNNARYAHTWKWPQLQELHMQCFGANFDDAHNALIDVTATLNCTVSMIKSNHIILAQQNEYMSIIAIDTASLNYEYLDASIYDNTKFAKILRFAIITVDKQLKVLRKSYIYIDGVTSIHESATALHGIDMHHYNSQFKFSIDAAVKLISAMLTLTTRCITYQQNFTNKHVQSLFAQAKTTLPLPLNITNIVGFRHVFANNMEYNTQLHQLHNILFADQIDVTCEYSTVLAIYNLLHYAKQNNLVTI
jgi:DNA polymerase III subunit epsilon